MSKRRQKDIVAGMKAYADGDRKRRRTYFPKRGNLILVTDLLLDGLSDYFTVSIREFRRLNPLPNDVERQYTQTAVNYVDENLDEIIAAAFSRMMSEAADHAARAVGMRGGEPLAVHKYLVAQEEREAKERLGLVKFSQWEPDRIELEIGKAFAQLKKPRRTYENVLAILKSAHGKSAPETPEALRKVVERAGVNWKQLKADTP